MLPVTQIVAAAAENDINGDIKSLSIRAILIATLVLVTLLCTAAVTMNHKKLKSLKKPLFIAIIAAITAPTLLLVGSTVYLNTVSESKGPVHWHTDIEFWVCDTEIEIRNPFEFLSNKVGTSTYHEHDDKRIHLEGVVVEKVYDASLEKFMDVTGGSIDNENLVIATEPNPFENDTDGDSVATENEALVREYLRNDDEGRTVLDVTNGDSCGSEGAGEVQAFLLRYVKDNDTYTQTKLEEPARYIMRDESIVPPGDCLIVEFDAPKDKTERLCQQYGVRDSERCTEFGVSEFNPELCNIRQVETTGGAQ